MEKEKTQILLTGATGFIGGAVLNKLIDQGFAPQNILCTTRRNGQVTDARVNWQTLDVSEPVTLEYKPNYIFHCAGVIDREERQINLVNVEGTRNIAEYSLRTGATMIHLSSVGVIGKTKKQRIDERTVGVPQNQYELSKFDAEAVIQEFVHKGLNARIVRPSTVIGYGRDPRKDSFLHLCQAILSGRYLHIGNGIYNLVHLDDVALAMFAALDEKIVSGEIFQVSFPISFKHLADVVCQFQGRDHIIPVIPRFCGYGLACFTSLFFALINRPNPLTFSRVRALTNSRVYAMDKILHDTKATFPKTIEERIWDTLCEYKAGGQFDGVKFL